MKRYFITKYGSWSDRDQTWSWDKCFGETSESLTIVIIVQVAGSGFRNLKNERMRPERVSMPEHVWEINSISWHHHTDPGYWTRETTFLFPKALSPRARSSDLIRWGHRKSHFDSSLLIAEPKLESTISRASLFHGKILAQCSRMGTDFKVLCPDSCRVSIPMLQSLFTWGNDLWTNFGGESMAKGVGTTPGIFRGPDVVAGLNWVWQFTRQVGLNTLYPLIFLFCPSLSLRMHDLYLGSKSKGISSVF